MIYEKGMNLIATKFKRLKPGLDHFVHFINHAEVINRLFIISDFL